MVQIVHADCMDILRKTPDLAYDICIADPPYGINAGKTCAHNAGGWHAQRKGFNSSKVQVYKTKKWDKEIPSEEWFSEIKRVSKNQIIFGANYFPHLLQPSKGWFFWEKNGVSKNPLFSDGELAYTSFKTKPLRKFVYPWIGLGYIQNPAKEKKIHPTQKPVSLYVWIMQTYCTSGDKILDTHLGSGSAAIAADMCKMNFFGIEKDKDYFLGASMRLQQYKNQLSLDF